MSSFIFLGDYIDRGPDSCATIDYLIALSQEYPCTFIRGNHDDMFLSILKPGSQKSNGEYQMLEARTTAQWFWRQGLEETCRSYHDLDEPDPFYIYRVIPFVPESHINFLANTVDSYIDERYACGHASPFGSDNDKLWSRYSLERYSEMGREAGRRIIVGHTPVKYFGFNEPIVQDHVIALDGGPYSREGFMSAYCLDDGQVFIERK